MERKIINAFLVVCLVAGFLCLVTLFLPSPPPGEVGVEIETKKKQKISEIVGDLSQKDSVKDEKDETVWETLSGVRISFKPEETPDTRPVNPLASLHPYRPLAPAPGRSRYYFNTPSELKEEVEFWRNVYARYPSSKTILHDSRNLNIVYGVLDFTQLEENPVLLPKDKKEFRERIEEKRKKEISEWLKNLHENRDSKSLDEEEKRFVRLFEETHDETALKDSADRVRGQRGQKDQFLEGIIRAAPYMTHLEKIFVEEGVPAELTRLAFVESMFQMKARSKAGAAGPFQFLQATGKKYLSIDRTVDDRLDPIRSGRAAAKLLKKQYEDLGTWPLSINAYNSGLQRMKKAVRELKTRNIATIIHRHDGENYGFASRNFYPEFLASLEVYDYNKNYFGFIPLAPPLEFVEIQTEDSIPLKDLADHLGMEVNLFRQYNPGFQSKLFEAGGHLPKHYPLRLPGTDRHLYLSAISELSHRRHQSDLALGEKGTATP